MNNRKWDGFGSYQKVTRKKVPCDICGDDRGRIYRARICDYCHAVMMGENEIDPYVNVEQGRKCDCCHLGGRRIFSINVCESCWINGVTKRRV